MKPFSAALIGFCACAFAPAFAVENKYHVTDAEQAACASDAIGLCSAAGEDADKLLGCMKDDRVKLSAVCRPVFDEGLRRRGMR